MTSAWLILALLGLAAVLAAPFLVQAEARWQASRRQLFPGSGGEARLSWRACCPLPVYLRLEWGAESALGLPPGEVRALAWWSHAQAHTLPYTARGRGVYAPPRPRLFAVDLLGLTEREVALEPQANPEGAEVLVYPEAFPLAGPDLRLTLLAEGPEAQGVGVEDVSRFAGVRDYAPGDPLNRLHWPSTAKRGQPVVKDFAKVRATGVWLHLDPAGEGKMGEIYIEHAASLAASLLRAAEEDGLAIGLSVGGDSLPLGRNEAQGGRALALLARAVPEGRPRPLPLPPAGVNLIVLTHQADVPLLESALLARARAARVHLVALPEGFYLRPGERGRPLYHRPASLARLQARRVLLEAEGVRVHLLRGDQGVWRLSAP